MNNNEAKEYLELLRWGRPLSEEELAGICRFGLGKRLFELRPLINEVRKKANDIVGKEVIKTTVEYAGQKYDGEMWLGNSGKDTITFSGQDLRMLIADNTDSNETKISFYTAKPNVNDGITGIALEIIPNNSMVKCEYFNELLSRYIDLIHLEKEAYLIRCRQLSRTFPDDFEVLWQKAMELYRNGEFNLKGFDIIDRSSAETFKTWVENILEERRREEKSEREVFRGF